MSGFGNIARGGRLLTTEAKSLEGLAKAAQRELDDLRSLIGAAGLTVTEENGLSFSRDRVLSLSLATSSRAGAMSADMVARLEELESGSGSVSTTERSRWNTAYNHTLVQGNPHSTRISQLLDPSGAAVIALPLIPTYGGTGLSAIGTANQLLGVNAAGTALEYKTNITVGTITSGLINGQTISSSANFTGSVNVTGAITGSNLSGTNTGDQTSIVGITGTLAEFNTALTGADFATGGGTATGTNTGDQTITLTGDVTGSGTGSFAATIANNAVTLAKMADIATASFLGRNTAATGDPEVLSIATAKTMLNLTGTNSGDQTITLTGDVTGSGTGSFAATIANNAVTLAKFQDIATASFLGRNTAATGDPEVLSIATAKTMLNLSGTNSGDVTLAGTPDYITIVGQVITRGLIVLTTDVSGILPAGNGGTNNAFFQVSGPATSIKTYTLPNSDSTIWTSTNDGTGSGLDADTVDGSHASAFLLLSGGTMAGHLAMGNFNITGVNLIEINDPGPNEGFHFAGGNLWRIYESPNDLTTNSAGNLQIVQNTTRRATFNTSGQIEVPIATGTAPFLISSTTAITNLNADLLDGNHATAFAASAHTHTLSGDVTGTVTGAVTIANDAVTYAKMQNVSSNGIILGRNTAGAGDVEELGVATVRTMLSLIANDIGAGTFNGTFTFANTARFNSVLNLIEAGASPTHYLQIKAGSILSADRVLTIETGDASRTLTLNGNTTLSGTNTGDQTITLTGNVTGSGTGSFATTIANDAVTYAKMQNVSATNRILGRATAGAGDVEELSTIPSAVLGGSSLFVGTTSIALNRASAAQALTGITSIDGSAATLTTTRNIAMTGDVAWNVNFNGSGNVTAGGTIANDAVTLAKMANVATGTVFYRKTAGTGDPEVQTLATLKTDLGLTGTNSGDITLAAVGASPNANAASLSGQQLTLQPASESFPGVVTTGTQSFAGEKTFSTSPLRFKTTYTPAGLGASWDYILFNGSSLMTPNTNSEYLSITGGATYDGTNWKYSISSRAIIHMAFNSGEFQIHTAAAGTQGNNVTFTHRFGVYASGAVKFPNLGTTASAANAFLNSGDSNAILRSTSSIRYKSDVISLVDDEFKAILSLRPIRYHSKASADDPNQEFVGLLAEEVAKIDPRLVTFLDGEPDGVQYERLTVLLIGMVKEQQKRIESLEVTRIR